MFTAITGASPSSPPKETVSPTLQPAAGISRTALVLAGNFLAGTGYEKSCLYSPSFTTGYRQASQEA